MGTVFKSSTTHNSVENGLAYDVGQTRLMAVQEPVPATAPTFLLVSTLGQVGLQK